MPTNDKEEAAAANIAAAGEKLDKIKDKRIIQSGKKEVVDVHVVHKTVLPQGQDKKRLENEASIFWKVYLKEVDTKDLGGKGEEESKDSESKNTVATNAAEKPRLSDVEEKRVTDEATIFWEVYYKVRDQKDPPKDVKGQTKITPATGAVAKVKGIVAKVKAGPKSWFSGLIDTLKPFVAAAILAIGPLILKIAAIAVAIKLAIDKIKKLVPGIGDAIEKIESMNKSGKAAQENNENLAKIAANSRREMEAEAKKLKATGDEAGATALQKTSKEKELQEAILAITRKHDEEALRKSKPTILKGIGSAMKVIGMSAIGQDYWGKENAYESSQKAYEKDRVEAYKKATADAEKESAPLKKALEDMRAAQEGKKKFMDEYGSKQTEIDPWGRPRGPTNLERAKFNQVSLKIAAENAWGIFANEVAAKKAEDALKTQKSRLRAEALKATGGAPSVIQDKHGGFSGTGVAADFVSRTGMPPFHFSSQDTLFGFKAGGPVSDFLKGGDIWGKFQLSEIQLSNTYLKQLVQLTFDILRKDTSGGGRSPAVVPPAVVPPDNSIQGDMSGPLLADGRAAFHDSAYSIHTPPVLA